MAHAISPLRGFIRRIFFKVIIHPEEDVYLELIAAKLPIAIVPITCLTSNTQDNTLNCADETFWLSLSD